MSGFITDLLDSALPTLERMSGTFAQIRGYEDDRKAQIFAAMDEAQSAFEPLLNYVLSNAGISIKEDEEKPVNEERSERVKKVSPKKVTTSTNRGVTPQVTNSPKPRRGKGLEVPAKKKVFPKS